MDYICLSNSNQNKYGSLMKHFKTQYALGNNQYCSNITTVKDVLINHTWDDTYKDNIKKKNQQKAEVKAKNNNNNNNNNAKKEDSNKSFVQTGNKQLKCFCCRCNHYISDCTKKDDIPKSEWAIKKGMQIYVSSKEESKNNND